MAVDDNTSQPSTGRRRVDPSQPDPAADAAKAAEEAQALEDARLAKEAEDARLAKEAEDARLAKEAEDAARAAENAAAEAANEGVDLYSAPKAASVLMKAPPDCAPITLGGVEHAPDEHGLVEIPAEFVAVVQSHGFEIV